MYLDQLFKKLFEAFKTQNAKASALNLQSFVDLRDPEDGNTLLHIAIKELSAACIKLQPYYGEIGSQKRTHEAANYAQSYERAALLVQVIRKLLDSGANIFIKNKAGETVYDGIKTIPSVGTSTSSFYLHIFGKNDIAVDAGQLPNPSEQNSTCILTTKKPLEKFHSTYASEWTFKQFSEIDQFFKNKFAKNSSSPFLGRAYYKTAETKKFTIETLLSMNGDFTFMQYLAALHKINADNIDITIQDSDLNIETIIENSETTFVTQHSMALLKFFNIHGHTKTAQDIVHAEKQSKIRAAIIGFDPNSNNPIATLQALADLITHQTKERKLIRHPCSMWDLRTWFYNEVDTTAYKLIAAALVAFDIEVPSDGFTEQLTKQVDREMSGDTSVYSSAELAALDDLGVYSGLEPGYFTRLAKTNSADFTCRV